MAYFSIPLELGATAYIKALTFARAEAKLQKILAGPLNATDQRWFSDVAIGSDTMPEVSFANVMTLWKPTQGSRLNKIDLGEVKQLLRPSADGRKSKVIPRSRNFHGNGGSPVFETDLQVRTIGIIKAVSLPEAEAFLATLCLPSVDWGDFDNWFTLVGLDEHRCPLVLSPNMLIDSVTPGCTLEITWPEEFDDGDVCDTKLPEEDDEIRIVVRNLRSHFASLGEDYSGLNDEDFQQMALLLIDLKNQRIAEGRWPSTQLIMPSKT